MSIAVQVFPIEKIKELSLEQFILPVQLADNFSFFIEISQSNFVIENDCQCNELLLENAKKHNAAIEPNGNIELVLFSQLKVATFLELVEHCQLTVQALSAINNRNNLISYRFSVQCKDIELSRKLLVNFSLNNKIETALLVNAPSLNKPGVLIMDMDSTTIEIECIDEIAALAGVGEEVSEVTELAMQGKLDFAQSLHQRVATLKNSPEQILADVAKDLPLMPGLENLVTVLKEHNWRVAIASGGFTYFADHLKSLLDLDAAHANTLEITNGYLTGKVLGDVVDAQAKAECLLQLSKEYGIEHQQTVAMGDGANDLVMMNAAHLGVAFHAKPVVLKQADSCINFSGLDCLLHWLA